MIVISRPEFNVRKGLGLPLNAGPTTTLEAIRTKTPKVNMDGAQTNTPVVLLQERPEAPGHEQSLWDTLLQEELNEYHLPSPPEGTVNDAREASRVAFAVRQRQQLGLSLDAGQPELDRATRASWLG